MIVTYSTVWKATKWERNDLMETSRTLVKCSHTLVKCSEHMSNAPMLLSNAHNTCQIIRIHTKCSHALVKFSRVLVKCFLWICQYFSGKNCLFSKDKNLFVHPKLWKVGKHCSMLCISTSEHMCKHVFAWSKTMKTLENYQKVLFSSYAQEAHVRLT